MTIYQRKWVESNGSNRPPVPWVEPSFRNWVEWTWVDLEKCQVLGRQHIDFDPIPFDPIRPQSIRPKLFDQKGRPNSFRPISFDPFHAIHSIRSLQFDQKVRPLSFRPEKFDIFTAGTGRFNKDVSAKKKFETFRQIFHAETSCIILVFFGFSTNWLGPVCRKPKTKPRLYTSLWNSGIDEKR